MNRRSFLAAAGAAVVAAAPAARATREPQASSRRARFRTGLVAYSYRQALQAKTMTYEDLIRIAVETDTDGIDMTVYWMPGTSDDYVLPLRRLAYKNRVEIYSLGTRVRLAQPTADLREAQIVELRKWMDVAQRIGATHIRVFGGSKPEGATLEQAIGFAAETLKRGAEYAGARGIILGVEDDGAARIEQCLASLRERRKSAHCGRRRSKVRAGHQRSASPGARLGSAGASGLGRK